MSDTFSSASSSSSSSSQQQPRGPGAAALRHDGISPLSLHSLGGGRFAVGEDDDDFDDGIDDLRLMKVRMMTMCRGCTGLCCVATLSLCFTVAASECCCRLSELKPLLERWRSAEQQQQL